MKKTPETFEKIVQFKKSLTIDNLKPGEKNRQALIEAIQQRLVPTFIPEKPTETLTPKMLFDRSKSIETHIKDTQREADRIIATLEIDLGFVIEAWATYQTLLSSDYLLPIIESEIEEMWKTLERVFDTLEPDIKEIVIVYAEIDTVVEEAPALVTAVTTVISEITDEVTLGAGDLQRELDMVPTTELTSSQKAILQILADLLASESRLSHGHIATVNALLNGTWPLGEQLTFTQIRRILQKSTNATESMNNLNSKIIACGLDPYIVLKQHTQIRNGRTTTEWSVTISEEIEHAVIDELRSKITTKPEKILNERELLEQRVVVDLIADILAVTNPQLTSGLRLLRSLGDGSLPIGDTFTVAETVKILGERQLKSTVRYLNRALSALPPPLNEIITIEEIVVPSQTVTSPRVHRVTVIANDEIGTALELELEKILLKKNKGEVVKPSDGEKSAIDLTREIIVKTGKKHKAHLVLFDLLVEDKAFVVQSGSGKSKFMSSYRCKMGFMNTGALSETEKEAAKNRFLPILQELEVMLDKSNAPIRIVRSGQAIGLCTKQCQAELRLLQENASHPNGTAVLTENNMVISSAVVEALD